MKKLSNGMAQVGHGPLRILTARVILRQWLRFAKQLLRVGLWENRGSRDVACTQAVVLSTESIAWEQRLGQLRDSSAS